MVCETISAKTNLIIRRHILEPGESLPWHRDLCHRFSVIIRGEQIAIEYFESAAVKNINVHPGLAEWDAPQAKLHRAVNVGKDTYEEVILFFITHPQMEPQPKNLEA